MYLFERERTTLGGGQERERISGRLAVERGVQQPNTELDLMIPR